MPAYTTTRAPANASHILQAAGTDLKHVVKTTVYLSDIANFAPMNEVYAQFFTEPFPARSAVAVKDLPKGALVEIEVLAVKPQKQDVTSSEETSAEDGASQKKNLK